MNYGICPLSVVPIRQAASDKSEMASQLLFGETVEILEKKGKWLRVRCTWDDYIGWADARQIKTIPDSEIKRYHHNFAYSLELVQAAMAEEYCLPITIGATLPEFDGLHFRLNGSKYTFSGQAISPQDIEPSSELILKIARRYLYAPYLWGGRSPMGIDCSGFTQIVYKIGGLAIPRDAAQQVHSGEMVDFVQQAQAADLAFFGSNDSKITHVGILISKNEIIHASGQVRIDKIDHFGIYNENTQKYSHKLRVVKRLLPSNLHTDSHIEDANETKDDLLAQNQVKLFP